MKSPQLFYSITSRLFYDKVMKGFSPLRQEVINTLDVQDDERVLIAGAGTGLDFLHTPKTGNFTAFDLNEDMLKQAKGRKRENISLLRADCHALPFHDATFDKVSCFLIVAIIPGPERFFRELHRVLKPGAKVVIFDKFYEKSNILLSTLNFFTSRVASKINFNFTDFYRKELHQSFKIISNEGKGLSGYFRLIQLEKLP